ncbi:MAG: DHA2 family efflux MFS transporter permease subunit [Streptosporangiales bacterium]|nr:DHA2 family efflux MFS transporter permease subunit [Streptosporangiales bacterium]
MTDVDRDDSSRAAEATPTNSTNSTALSHRQILVVLGGLMAGMLLAALDQSIVGTALPRIVSELGGLDHLSWVVTAYLLTATASTPLWGKISDLYGRRLIFQIAIGIFLVGSVLAGLSQDMTQLIGSRAVQGMGGGGLMSIALAIVGDVIPARQRGKYQGYFGVVFGVSSVAGPLMGGFFTDGPGWRWIFWINVPIGLAALVVTSLALRMPLKRREHRIDYLGAMVIVAAVSSLLLYLNWAGNEYGWFAGRSLALLGGAIALAVVFVVVEHYAEEPIIPLRLFRNRVFSVGNLFAALCGVAMFGAIVFFPLYLQAVMGMSPTMSGLGMLPAVAGIFTTSIGSGQLMTRTGRYKIFPILGGATLIVALLLLSTLTFETPYWQAAIFVYFFGAGLGFTMQTIVTAVQNSVAMSDMGAATSSTVFFRQTGGAIGTAVFGAVLSSRLSTYLAEELAGAVPPGTRTPNVDANNIEAIQRLQEPLKTPVLTAFSNAIDDVFLVGVPFVAAAFIVSLFLKELPLRTSNEVRPPADAPKAPADEVRAASD